MTRHRRTCRDSGPPREHRGGLGPRSAADLDAQGCAVIGPLLTADECAALAALYPHDAPFRSRVIMARHGFGRGEYKYFAYPLPDAIAALRDGALSRRSPRSPTAGTRRSASRRAIRPTHADVSRALPRGRPDAADAAAPAIWRGRLQLPAPGPLRRARLSAAGDRPAVAAGRAISPAASSCSPSSARACSRAPRSCRSSRARP